MASDSEPAKCRESRLSIEPTKNVRQKTILAFKLLESKFSTGAAGAAFAGVHVQCGDTCDNRAKFENINKNKHLPFGLRLLGSNNR